MSAYTSNSPGAGLVEFQTVTNIPFATSNRFISFSADVAALNCRVAFGDNDRYLTAAYGAGLAALFPRGEATPIAGAAHFPQLDAPADVARAILGVPSAPGEEP